IMPDGRRVRLGIINGYPRENQEVLTRVGMCSAHGLFERALHQIRPDLRFEFEILWPADPRSQLPDGKHIAEFDGYLWTGSNLTVFEDDPRVSRQIEFARLIFEVGRPQWGSCWGIQIAAVAAGGEVRRNPHGREMGFARKIVLTPEGRTHPMYEGKPQVFDGFISHLDEVIRLPEGTPNLATNDHSAVQAMEVRYGSGTFWATQYHPEYTLYEMARLITARGDALLREGFFADHAAIEAKVERMELLAREPGRKDLRWDLVLGDDILDDQLRQCELRNWLAKQVVRTTVPSSL
ncbi:MAG: type 1 glutamine amidotransferase, partial [bacterium]